MSAAKEEILNRIRAAIGAGSGSETPIPRDYIQSATLSADQRLDLFIDRLHDYDALVHRVPETRIAETIASILQARNFDRIVIPAGLPTEWLPPGFAFRRDDDLSYDDLDQAQGVLTAATIAIALTGTIVLQHAPGQGRRAITLIPDYHLCIVFAEQVLATVPEGIRFLEPTKDRATTTISGPSATADIEMKRVKGVHGPRTLEVVLVV